MAEYRFSILEVRADLMEQSIFIEMTHDVDEDTLSAENIYLIDAATQVMAPVDIIADGSTVQLKLKNWAVPNQKYTLIVQPTIESIVGQKLKGALLKNIVFESKVVSTIKIVSPYNYKAYKKNINLSWREKTDGARENSFYIEISDDTNFFNVIYRTFIDHSYVVDANNDYLHKATIEPLEKYGQYYVRIRAQKENGEYGKWSDSVTFDYSETVKKKEKTEEIEQKPINNPSEENGGSKDDESNGNEHQSPEGNQTSDNATGLAGENEEQGNETQEGTDNNPQVDQQDPADAGRTGNSDGDNADNSGDNADPASDSGRHDIPASDQNAEENQPGNQETENKEEPEGKPVEESEEKPVEEPDEEPTEEDEEEHSAEEVSNETTEEENPTIEIEDKTGIEKKPIILSPNPVTLVYEEVMDYLPDKNFSIFFPDAIDISQATVEIVRRDI